MKSPTSSDNSASAVAHCELAQTAQVRLLDELDYEQALALLGAHPMQGVHLESLINDHGLTSPDLRGHFFGHFENGELTGIALIGHQIMFCALNEAIPSLARTAADSSVRTSLIFGPREQVEIFWQHYATRGHELKLQRDFFWYVCEAPAQPLRQFQLIQATVVHLEDVMEAQASMFIESAVTDPRQKDPEGFRRRVLERIERGRTWIKIENNTIVFKAELQSVTPEVIYLEGIWTHPSYRQRGIARASVVELTHRRLRQRQVLCLAVEPDETVAMHIYEHAGFRYQADYQARYPHPFTEISSPESS
ncbi:MAG: GNAT family N-acetyltransferase [Acidobacteria bacterium]|nr:GNAT family N-acetyltransferase [Acidobacteriota bacterium]